MVRHVVMHGPGHDLQQVAVERRRQTGPVGSAGAGGMKVVEINARPEDLNEFLKGVTSFR